MLKKSTNFFREIRQLKAQAIIEFSLLLPILLLLVLGAIDFGRLFYVKIVLTNAAREGANYLSFHTFDQDDGYVQTLAVVQAEADSSGVQVDPTDVQYFNCCTQGEKVGVQVSRPVNLVFDGFLQSLGLLDGPVVLVSIAYMVVQ